MRLKPRLGLIRRNQVIPVYAVTFLALVVFINIPTRLQGWTAVLSKKSPHAGRGARRRAA